MPSTMMFDLPHAANTTDAKEIRVNQYFTALNNIVKDFLDTQTAPVAEWKKSDILAKLHPVVYVLYRDTVINARSAAKLDHALSKAGIRKGQATASFNKIAHAIVEVEYRLQQWLQIAQEGRLPNADEIHGADWVKTEDVDAHLQKKFPTAIGGLGTGAAKSLGQAKDAIKTAYEQKLQDILMSNVSDKEKAKQLLEAREDLNTNYKGLLAENRAAVKHKRTKSEDFVDQLFVTALLRLETYHAMNVYDLKGDTKTFGAGSILNIKSLLDNYIQDHESESDNELLNSAKEILEKSIKGALTRSAYKSAVIAEIFVRKDLAAEALKVAQKNSATSIAELIAKPEAQMPAEAFQEMKASSSSAAATSSAPAVSKSKDEVIAKYEGKLQDLARKLLTETAGGKSVNTRDAIKKVLEADLQALVKELYADLGAFTDVNSAKMGTRQEVNVLVANDDRLKAICSAILNFRHQVLTFVENSNLSSNWTSYQTAFEDKKKTAVEDVEAIFEIPVRRKLSNLKDTKVMILDGFDTALAAVETVEDLQKLIDSYVYSDGENYHEYKILSVNQRAMTSKKHTDSEEKFYTKANTRFGQLMHKHSSEYVYVGRTAGYFEKANLKEKVTEIIVNYKNSDSPTPFQTFEYLRAITLPQVKEYASKHAITDVEKRTANVDMEALVKFLSGMSKQKSAATAPQEDALVEDFAAGIEADLVLTHLDALQDSFDPSEESHSAWVGFVNYLREVHLYDDKNYDVDYVIACFNNLSSETDISIVNAAIAVLEDFQLEKAAKDAYAQLTATRDAHVVEADVSSSDEESPKASRRGRGPLSEMLDEEAAVVKPAQASVSFVSQTLDEAESESAQDRKEAVAPAPTSFAAQIAAAKLRKADKTVEQAPAVVESTPVNSGNNFQAQLQAKFNQRKLAGSSPAGQSLSFFAPPALTEMLDTAEKREEEKSNASAVQAEAAVVDTEVVKAAPKVAPQRPATKPKPARPVLTASKSETDETVEKDPASTPKLNP